MSSQGLWLAGVLALGVRLAYLANASWSPLQRTLDLDPRLLDAAAQSIARGVDPEPGPYFRPPLFTHFLAAIYAVFGHSLDAARVVLAILGACTAIVLGLITSSLWGRRAGAIAAVLFALYGPAIFFTGELVSATLEVFLAACGILLMLRVTGGHGMPLGAPREVSGSRGPGARDGVAALAGLFLSLGAITRPTILPFTFAGTLWLRATRVSRWTIAAFLVAGVSLPLFVTLRNGLVGKDWVAIASGGGINFYIGNNPFADGTTPSVPGTGAGIEATHEAPARLASAALGRPLRASEVSSYWFQKGVAFWIHEPTHAVALYAKKIALMWNRRELPNTQDQAFTGPYHSVLFRVPVLLGFAGLAPIALAMAWIERRRAALLTIYLGMFTLTTAAFFVCDRFRLPLIVGIIPLAAAGLDAFWSRLKSLRSGLGLLREHWRIVLLLALGAAVVWLPFPDLQAARTGISWYRVARAYEKEGDFRKAKDAYSAAEQAGFSTPTFLTDYGMCELRNQDPVAAEPLFRRALEQDSRYGPAHEGMAAVNVFSKQWETVAQEYETAAKLIPERSAELYAKAAYAYVGAGQAGRARELLRAALAIRPGFAPAVEGLARLDSEGR